jgi:hypothetical protein
MSNYCLNFPQCHLQTFKEYIKRKQIPVSAIKAYGGVEVHIHSLLISVLNGGFTHGEIARYQMNVSLIVKL